MQIREIACDSEGGSIEFTFSKREMQIEGCMVSADYLLDKDHKYKITIYIGLVDVEIMEKLMEMQMEGTVGKLKEAIKSYVSAYFNIKQNRKSVRDRLKVMEDAQDFNYRKSEVYELDISKLIESVIIRVLVDREKNCYSLYKVMDHKDMKYVYSVNLNDQDFDIHSVCTEIKNNIDIIEKIQ